MTTARHPIALEAYEALARAYEAKAETKAENGYNEHPAMRRCLGPVAGLDVLDAGCGPGFLTRDLLAAGARRVVGLDVSPTMLRLARARVGKDVPLIEGNLAEPQPALENESFDLVASSLALDYVRDWSIPLGEFARILRPGGRLVMSIQHPMGAYAWFKPASAFGVHYCEVPWRGFTPEPVVVPDHYRSFEEVINPVPAAGFRLDGLHETRPDPRLKAIDPDKFQRNDSFPTFLVVMATKPQVQLNSGGA